MNRFATGLLTVLVSTFVLNGCADEPQWGEEEEGGSESNLAVTRRDKNAGKNKPAAPTGGGIGNRAGKTIDTTANANTKTTPAAAPAPAPAPAANNDNGGGNAMPVLVTWNGVANTEASLDVVLSNGQIIGPCIAVDILRDEFQRGVSDGLRYLFTGNCISAGQSPDPADIRAFRICSAFNNDWANATCTEGAPWNHTNAAYHIDN